MSDNTTTEQPRSGLNIVPDDEANDHADKMQKQQDLRKMEEEIRMLRQVLNEKVKQARELRISLGMATTLDNLEHATKNIEDNINQFAEDVAHSDAYKKTASTLQGIGQVTAESFTTLGATVTEKFNVVKNSDSYNKISNNVSTFGSSILESVQNITKPKQQEFNEGNN